MMVSEASESFSGGDPNAGDQQCLSTYLYFFPFHISLHADSGSVFKIRTLRHLKLLVFSFP
ncbi:MAG: hypothetical protein R2806_10950 [Saprospiraceae bacterium]